MKRRVLVKTTSFHAFHWKKKEKRKKKEVNGVVLNNTISLLLPLDAQRTGEEEDFVPLHLLLSLSLPKPKKKPDRAPHLYVSTAHTSHDEE
jgi:hypothetical protein